LIALEIQPMFTLDTIYIYLEPFQNYRSLKQR
jgi:hypothetical protein